MANSLNLKDNHPKKPFTDITQTGIKAHDLALTYQTEIDARLPGTREGLRTDLDALGVVVPGAVQTRHEAQAATTAQNTLLEQGYARVQAIRQTVRKAGAAKDVRRAYGVGQKLDPRVVRDVKAGLQQIVDRATTASQEAAAFGLNPPAVAELKTFVTSLADAVTTQETKRAHAPLSTKKRNLIANRVLQSAVLIAGAGMLAFADTPLTRASFEALMASTKKTAAAPKARKQPDAPPSNGA